MLLIDAADTAQSSLLFEPRPHGHAQTVAPGFVLKSEISRQSAEVGVERDTMQ